MAAILSTNMASLYAQKNLSTAQASLSDSVQRLSSGTRINSAKDDAAGYGIAESVRGTKNIVDQNIRNAKDGISWAQTAEGALDVVGKILQRSLTLATQAQDPTLNAAQRTSIGNELVALNSEINNIAVRTKFQGGSGQISVFGSSQLSSAGTAGIPSTGANSSTRALSGTINVQTGSGTATAVTANMIDTHAADGLVATATAIVGGAAATAAQVTMIEAIIATNSTNRGTLGAAINSLEYAVDNMQTLSTNLADGISRIVDTDYAAETSNLTRTQILQQAATSMLAQANQMPNVILTLLK
jgi:flagellin